MLCTKSYAKDSITIIHRKRELKNYDILMGNGLSIKSANVQEENGSKVIKAVLEGTQTEHTIDAAYRGTIIIFNTDLTVNKLTPDNKSKVVMKYTNEIQKYN